MNSEIRIYDNTQFGQLRGMNINGDAWLMATDVARRLGYSNPPKAIRDHVDEEDKTVNETFTVNGTTPVLINESGLYALVLSSRMPRAREFKHWVTSEVLPSIRRDGGYLLTSKEMDEEEIMARAVLLGQKRIEALRQQLAEQQPKVAFADAIAASGDSILIRDLAKLITQNGYTIGQNRLFEWMRLNGYLFQHENRPMQRYVEMGLFETSVTLVSTHHGTLECLTTKVTGKGQQYFIQKFMNI